MVALGQGGKCAGGYAAEISGIVYYVTCCYAAEISGFICSVTCCYAAEISVGVVWGGVGGGGGGGGGMLTFLVLRT